MKDLRQKWKVKLIFQGAYRLSGTAISECFEISDVGVIWISLTAWPNWPEPQIIRQIYAADHISQYNEEPTSHKYVAEW